MDLFPYVDNLCNRGRSRILTAVIYGEDGGKVHRQNILRLVLSGTYESIDIDALIINMTQEGSRTIGPGSRYQN